MPCRPLPGIFCTLDSVQSLKFSLLPKVHGISLQTNAVLVWIFPRDLLPSFACFYRVSRPTVFLFPQCTSCQIRRECYRSSQQSSVKHVLVQFSQVSILWCASFWKHFQLLYLFAIRFNFLETPLILGTGINPSGCTSFFRRTFLWGFVDNRINP